MSIRAANAYKKVSVESASPTRVLDELFTRLRLDLRLAREAIAAADVPERCRALSQALQLVGALESGLDASVAPELCANLRLLYAFVREQVFNANAQGVSDPIDRADEVIAEIHDAFRASEATAQAA